MPAPLSPPSPQTPPPNFSSNWHLPKIRGYPLHHPPRQAKAGHVQQVASSAFNMASAAASASRTCCRTFEAIPGSKPHRCPIPPSSDTHHRQYQGHTYTRAPAAPATGTRGKPGPAAAAASHPKARPLPSHPDSSLFVGRTQTLHSPVDPPEDCGTKKLAKLPYVDIFPLVACHCNPNWKMFVP